MFETEMSRKEKTAVRDSYKRVFFVKEFSKRFNIIGKAELERSSICSFAPQTATTAGAKPIQRK